MSCAQGRYERAFRTVVPSSFTRKIPLDFSQKKKILCKFVLLHLCHGILTTLERTTDRCPRKRWSRDMSRLALRSLADSVAGRAVVARVGERKLRGLRGRSCLQLWALLSANKAAKRHAVNVCGEFRKCHETNVEVKACTLGSLPKRQSVQSDSTRLHKWTW